jgi:hypothetical protein
MASIRRGESSSFLLCRSSAISFSNATTASCRQPCVFLPWFLRPNPLAPNHKHRSDRRCRIRYCHTLNFAACRAVSCVVQLFTWTKETRGSEALLHGCDGSRIPLEFFKKLQLLWGSRCSWVRGLGYPGVLGAVFHKPLQTARTTPPRRPLECISASASTSSFAKFTDQINMLKWDGWRLANSIGTQKGIVDP